MSMCAQYFTDSIFFSLRSALPRSFLLLSVKFSLRRCGCISTIVWAETMYPQLSCLWVLCVPCWWWYLFPQNSHSTLSAMFWTIDWFPTSCIIDLQCIWWLFFIRVWRVSLRWSWSSSSPSCRGRRKGTWRKPSLVGQERLFDNLKHFIIEILWKAQSAG